MMLTSLDQARSFSYATLDIGFVFYTSSRYLMHFYSIHDIPIGGRPPLAPDRVTFGDADVEVQVRLLCGYILKTACAIICVGQLAL